MRQRLRGLTLVEACVAVAVLAILLATAVPSMRELLQRRQLRGSADELRSDLQYLRAAAMARGQRLWIEVGSGAEGSCYVLHDGDKGDCGCTGNGVTACSHDAQVLRAATFPVERSIGVLANVAAQAFEPSRGLATPSATFRLQSAAGEEVRHLVSASGRVRSCSPGGRVPGYRVC